MLICQVREELAAAQRTSIGQAQQLANNEDLIRSYQAQLDVLHQEIAILRQQPAPPVPPTRTPAVRVEVRLK